MFWLQIGGFRVSKWNQFFFWGGGGTGLVQSVYVRLWAGQLRGMSLRPCTFKIYILFKSSRLTLGPTQPKIQWVLGALSPGKTRRNEATRKTIWRYGDNIKMDLREMRRAVIARSIWRRAMGWMTPGVWIPVRSRIVSLLRIVQTDSGGPPSSLSSGSRGHFHWWKRVRGVKLTTHPPPPTGADVKNTWFYTSTPPYVSMALYWVSYAWGQLYLREIGWRAMTWINLAQDRDHCRALVNMVRNLRVP
jgi:hypothetical protein